MISEIPASGSLPNWVVSKGLIRAGHRWGSHLATWPDADAEDHDRLRHPDWEPGPAGGIEGDYWLWTETLWPRLTWAMRLVLDARQGTVIAETDDRASAKPLWSVAYAAGRKELLRDIASRPLSQRVVDEVDRLVRAAAILPCDTTRLAPSTTAEIQSLTTAVEARRSCAETAGSLVRDELYRLHAAVADETGGLEDDASDDARTRARDTRLTTFLTYRAQLSTKISEAMTLVVAAHDDDAT